MKRWRILAVGVVLLAVVGTVVVVNSSSNDQGELAATAGGKTERMDVQPLEEPKIVPASPAPSPIAHIPSPAPTPPAEAPPAGRPGVRGPGADIHLPGPSPEPATPGGAGAGEDGSGPNLGNPSPTAEIVLARTIDEVGDPHTLVLNVADDAAAALVQANDLFAVVSGGSKFSVAGDASVGSWRFAVDSATPGPGAPIVVIKGAAGRSMQDLAAVPGLYTSAAALNEDPLETSVRLTALISEVISKAEPTQSDRSFYTMLARQLTDPAWTGVMIFNASATVPAEVLGHSTGALADRQVGVLNMAFETPPMTSIPGPSSMSGIIDQAQDSGDALPPDVRYLRARFFDSALVAFDQG